MKKTIATVIIILVLGGIGYYMFNNDNTQDIDTLMENQTVLEEEAVELDLLEETKPLENKAEINPVLVEEREYCSLSNDDYKVYTLVDQSVDTGPVSPKLIVEDGNGNVVYTEETSQINCPNIIYGEKIYLSESSRAGESVFTMLDLGATSKEITYLDLNYGILTEDDKFIVAIGDTDQKDGLEVCVDAGTHTMNVNNSAIWIVNLETSEKEVIVQDKTKHYSIYIEEDPIEGNLLTYTISEQTEEGCYLRELSEETLDISSWTNR